MSLLLKNRDYAVNESGGVTVVTGGEALLNEALFRLVVRQGSFPFLPRLGSRMYLLKREKPSAWADLAAQYAAEALADLSDLTVTGAAVTRRGDALWAEISLEWKGEELAVTAELEG